jgi:hypothetical protein
MVGVSERNVNDPVPVGSCNPGADFCQQTPTDLAIEPNGKYLYAALDMESALAGFAIDRSTGALSNLPGSHIRSNPHKEIFARLMRMERVPIRGRKALIPAASSSTLPMISSTIFQFSS